MKIMREEFASSFEYVDIYNIVVIYIIHLNSIIIVITLINLKTSRVHLHIKMISVIGMLNHGITLDERFLIQWNRFLFNELVQISFICGLHQLHDIPTLCFEFKQMSRLLHDRILHFVGSFHDKRIGVNIKINRLTRRVWIIYRITLHAKSHVISIIVKPNALKHLLSGSIFLDGIRWVSLMATSNHSHQTSNGKQYPNMASH